VAEDEEAQTVAKKIRESRREIRNGVLPSVETPAEGVRTPEMREKTICANERAQLGNHVYPP